MSYEDRISTTVDEIEILLDGLPPEISIFLWGPPGIGKSTVIKQYVKKKAKELKRNFGFNDLRLSTMDPTDLRGLPWVDKENNLARWAEPSMLPHTGKNGKDPKEGILFLDELPNAHPTIQSAALQLTFDRKSGEYEVPEGWRVIAAGNRIQDMSGAFQMLRSLNNRFIHFEIVADKRVWINWAIESALHPDVIGFISNNPDALAPQPTNATDSMRREFASPRTWEFTSKILQSSLFTTSPKMAQKAIVGAIGAAWARQFITWQELKDHLPDNDGIFVQGEKLPLPTEIHFQFAFYSSVCSYIDMKVSENPKIKSDKKFMEGLAYILSELPNPEFKELILRHLSAHHKFLITGLMTDVNTAKTITRLFSDLGLASIFTSINKKAV